MEAALPELLEALMEGPLLVEGAVSSSPMVEVLPTRLGKVAVLSEQGARALGVKRRRLSEGALMRKALERWLQGYGASRGVPVWRTGPLFWVGGVAVSLDTSRRSRKALLKAAKSAPAVSVSAQPFRKGTWVRLKPGCHEDLKRVLDAHLLGVAKDPPPAGL